MAFYFVQHGKSYAFEEDPQQGLTEAGMLETEKVAQAVQPRIYKLNQIYHSGKKRTEQTALIFAKVLGLEEQVAILDGIKPMDDVKSFALVLPEDALIVSHLPFLEKLTNYLVGGDESLKTNVVNYANSHVVCLEKNMHTGFQLAWII
ncbi:phosphohistidine phosphatase SixA [Legionella sp. W05-934-2]|jgi:phosphohistidine phosphatase|uniref:phosphohistidine phosphatase SixA n=1 Tax=Legionella sp. W05-934-2 TaxID=1198649 RepID=UPI0034627344